MRARESSDTRRKHCNRMASDHPKLLRMRKDRVLLPSSQETGVEAFSPVTACMLSLFCNAGD